MVRSKCQAGESEKLVLPWTTFVVSSWWIGETSIAMDIFCCVYYRASHEGQPNTIERVIICLGNMENREIESDSLNWTVYCTVYQI